MLQTIISYANNLIQTKFPALSLWYARSHALLHLFGTGVAAAILMLCIRSLRSSTLKVYADYRKPDMDTRSRLVNGEFWRRATRLPTYACHDVLLKPHKFALLWTWALSLVRSVCKHAYQMSHKHTTKKDAASHHGQIDIPICRPSANSTAFQANTLTVAVIVIVIVMRHSWSTSVVTSTRRCRVDQITLLTSRISWCPVYSNAVCRRWTSWLTSRNRCRSVSSSTVNVGVGYCSAPCISTCATLKPPNTEQLASGFN